MRAARFGSKRRREYSSRRSRRPHTADMPSPKPFFEELDFQPTPLGDLVLRRRTVAMLGDLTVHEVMLGDSFLMTSMFHAVEDAVSDLALRELGGGPCDAVVGGLGLGYTAAAALAYPQVRSLRVVEFLPPVIDWHRRGLVPLGPRLTADPRCVLAAGDFFALATSPLGFDQARKYHAILLDIDHTPRDHLASANAGFYTTASLRAMTAHLHPGGVFSMWSDDPPDAVFVSVLQTVFATVRAEVITFPNPLLDRDSAGTVYLARTAGA